MAEAAVVGIHDELSGQAVNAFVSLKEGNESTDQVKKDLVLQVRKSIGPFAAPKAIFVVDDLPKTRSGKIMRRILRKILSGEEDSLGDTSTVSSPASRYYLSIETCAAIGPQCCGQDYRKCAGFEKEVEVLLLNPEQIGKISCVKHNKGVLGLKFEKESGAHMLAKLSPTGV